MDIEGDFNNTSIAPIAITSILICLIVDCRVISMNIMRLSRNFSSLAYN